MQHQQRSARIDLIMKLFPENGNILNTTQNHATPAHTTTQSTAHVPAAPLMPFIMNNTDAINSHKTMQSMPLNSLIVDKKINSYPHEMDCDPVTINPAIPMQPVTHPTTQSSRYNFLLSSLQTSASNSNLSASHLPDADGSHRSAVLRDYAPASLPIGVYSSKANNDPYPLAVFQHHLLVNSVAPNGNVSYIPYSMSNEAVNASMPKNSNTITSSSSMSSS